MDREAIPSTDGADGASLFQPPKCAQALIWETNRNSRNGTLITVSGAASQTGHQLNATAPCDARTAPILLRSIESSKP